ncbi:uncharacterized protein LOC129318742 isoform X2 [Prosopis cineraria]|uniref:uncharacterized protein LOC129318742 isoform X2 n=1 Tax=Prosopis cineraria TaxID=364024 RepID=UPI00240EB7D8|nr:uncharacterized protein LOC129318742 isoform X2 [Prosopis cineraria]
MDYSTYQQQQQQEQGYESSQNQAFDQSSQSYYGYNQQYDQQYAYYAGQGQGSSYAHPQFQQEHTSIHPPGVPIPPEQAQIQNPQFSNQDSGAALGAAMNPAAAAVAIAALSQLTQFAGNPPIGQSRYRGGSRGSRPFRRGGRGHFNPRGHAPYRGGGRGHGGGRHFPSYSSEFVPAATGGTSVAQQPSSSVSGPILAQVPDVTLHPPPCKFWCEICKVECNSSEIMEQHKNGKRHKKNLQVHEELQRRKAVNGQQNSQMPSSQLNLTAQVEKAPELKTEGCPADNMISVVMDDNLKNELDLQNNTGETSEVTADDPEENPREGSASRGHGFKRKMRGGRGGKYMRNNEGSRKKVEPPKPKQATSFICELCNVICESQVVYDSHLTGKKHQSNLKRVHGHQAMSQEPGPQAAPPANISAVSNSIDINALANSINSQVQHGVNDPQVLLAQLLMTVLSQAQASTAAAATTGSVAAQLSSLMPAAGSSYGPPFQNIPLTRASESAAHGKSSEIEEEVHKTPVENPTATIEQGP